MENKTAHESIMQRRLESAVEITAQLFIKHGIKSVKMTDIANECGIGVNTLYRHFGSKNGITVAAMTFMWNEMKKMFGNTFESDAFAAQTGIKQIRILMRLYIVLYQAHPGFIKLLAEFDNLLIGGSIPKSELKEYERSIINFYPVFEKAYFTGISDGTVREIPDIMLFYLSFAHSLTELCKKFIQGELLPNDDFSDPEKELGTLIDSAVFFLTNK